MTLPDSDIKAAVAKVAKKKADIDQWAADIMADSPKGAKHDTMEKQPGSTRPTVLHQRLQRGSASNSAAGPMPEPKKRALRPPAGGLSCLLRQKGAIRRKDGSMNEIAKCDFIPGGPECGCQEATGICKQTIEACRGFGNEKNFGGYPPIEGHGTARTIPSFVVNSALKVEEVTSFRTTDNKIFTHACDAEKHQAQIDFIEWYCKGNEILGNVAGCKIDAIDLLDWLEANGEILEQFFKFLL